MDVGLGYGQQDTPSQEDSSHGTTNEQADTRTSDRPHAPEVTQLAAAILSYVTAASALGSVMLSTVTIKHQGNGARDAMTQQTKVTADGTAETGDHDTGGTGDELQLLRMRTKRQEIIIYPDSKYLCCVVQSVAKPNESSAGQR